MDFPLFHVQILGANSSGEIIIQVSFGRGTLAWQWQIIRSYQDCKRAHTEICRSDRSLLVRLQSPFPFYIGKFSKGDEKSFQASIDSLQNYFSEFCQKVDLFRYKTFLRFLDVDRGLEDLNNGLTKFQTLYRKYKVFSRNSIFRTLIKVRSRRKLFESALHENIQLWDLACVCVCVAKGITSKVRLFEIRKLVQSLNGYIDTGKNNFHVSSISVKSSAGIEKAEKRISLDSVSTALLLWPSITIRVVGSVGELYFSRREGVWVFNRHLPAVATVSSPKPHISSSMDSLSNNMQSPPWSPTPLFPITSSESSASPCGHPLVHDHLYQKPSFSYPHSPSSPPPDSPSSIFSHDSFVVPPYCTSVPERPPRDLKSNFNDHAGLHGTSGTSLYPLLSFFSGVHYGSSIGSNEHPMLNADKGIKTYFKKIDETSHFAFIKSD